MVDISCLSDPVPCQGRVATAESHVHANISLTAPCDSSQVYGVRTRLPEPWRSSPPVPTVVCNMEELEKVSAPAAAAGLPCAWRDVLGARQPLPLMQRASACSWASFRLSLSFPGALSCIVFAQPAPGPVAPSLPLCGTCPAKKHQSLGSGVV